MTEETEVPETIPVAPPVDGIPRDAAGNVDWANLPEATFRDALAAANTASSAALTPEQLAATIADLRASGVPEDTVAKVIADSGMTEGEDQRSPEAVEFDDLYGADTTTPDKYHPTFVAIPIADPGPYREAAVAFASAASLPPLIGDHLIELAASIEVRNEAMTDEQRGIAKANAEADLWRMQGGEDGAKATVAAAVSVLAKASPALLERWERAGVLSNVEFLRHLEAHAARLKYRESA